MAVQRIALVDSDTLTAADTTKLEAQGYVVIEKRAGRSITLLTEPGLKHPDTDDLLRSLRNLVQQDPLMDPRVALVQLCNILLGEPGRSCAVQPAPTGVEASTVQRVATEIRHRNEDLVPGRIVHVVRGAPEQRVCLAAILTRVCPNPEFVDLTIFLPPDDPGTATIRARLVRDNHGAVDTWHFSIACAEVMARARA